MNRDEIVGFAMTPAIAEQYYLRLIEAEKKMGPLSLEERITILKSMATSITMQDLMDEMAGKRVLIVGQKPADEKGN